MSDYDSDDFWMGKYHAEVNVSDDLRCKVEHMSCVADTLQKAFEQAEAERDELKRRVEELESFLDWIERDEMWDKTWRQIRSEWKEAGE